MKRSQSINPKPELGDMIQFKDVRMDGSIRSRHLGIIYAIKRGFGFIQWIENSKPSNYSDEHGFSIMKIQQEYDVFSIVSKVADVKQG